MTTKIESNGQVRRTLASQLDRLDGILDGLSDGLNQAVADAVSVAVKDAVSVAVSVAVKEAAGVAVREALQAVLTEVLTNPGLLEHLQPTMPLVAHNAVNPPADVAADPPADALAVPGRPGLGERMATARAWAGQKASAARTACRRALGNLGSGLLALWRLRTRLLAAVGIGAAIGLGAYLAGPWLSALAGGVAGGVVSLVHRVRDWLQQRVLGRVLANATP
jgi:hypothetical protein